MQTKRTAWLSVEQLLSKSHDHDNTKSSSLLLTITSTTRFESPEGCHITVVLSVWYLSGVDHFHDLLDVPASRKEPSRKLGISPGKVSFPSSHSRTDTPFADI